MVFQAIWHRLLASLSLSFRYSEVVATMLHDGSDFKLDGRTDFNIGRSSARDHSTESVVGNEPYSRLAGLGFGVFGPRDGDDIASLVSRKLR